MKRPKQGSMNKSRILKKKLLTFILITSVLAFLFACENDIEKINEFAAELDIPDQSGKDIEIIYSDSGIVKLKFRAPVLERYTKIKNPYYRFPKGIHADTYDKNGKLEAVIKADSALYYEKGELWEILGNVSAKNVQTNEELNTDQLFWDQKKGTIYSDVFTRIVNEDGEFYGEYGFESNQDLTDYKLKGSTGTVDVEDE